MLSQTWWSSWRHSGSSSVTGSITAALGNSVTPSTLNTSTLWWAAIARPDSVTMVGCVSSASSHAPTTAATTSAAYSSIV